MLGGLAHRSHPEGLGRWFILYLHSAEQQIRPGVRKLPVKTKVVLRLARHSGKNASRHLSTLETTASRHDRLGESGGVRLGWIVGIFLSSLIAVVTVIVAAAWIVGGRVASTDPTVHELLSARAAAGSPDPVWGGSQRRPPDCSRSLASVRNTSPTNLQWSCPAQDRADNIREIPVESITALKSMGWAVPYLSRRGFDHEYAETSSLDGVRTIQARLSNGDHYINVAETRPEGPDVELRPLSDKLHEVVNLDSVVAETVELATGHEANLYLAEEGATWTAAVENSAVQYVITSDMPTEAASDISSWVLVTDRSRVQMLPSSPGTADRLERGFDELFAIFDS